MARIAAAGVRARNGIPTVLVLAAVASLVGLGFLSHAPNRIVPGVSLPIWSVAGPVALALVALVATALAACGLLKPSRFMILLQACLLFAAFVGLMVIAGHGAEALAVGKPPGARTSLAAGFWLSMAALALAAVDLAQEARVGPWGKALSITACVLSVVGLGRIGAFDKLSLVREFYAHADTFQTELVRHLVLVGASVSLASAIGLPVGLLAAKRPVLGQRMMGVLGIVQTIPSIALFGLLIGPLSGLVTLFPGLRALGISGIGTTPAIIALVLYGLLPMVRNTATALDGVSPSAIEAAAGNGMRPRQILFKVRLPLAMPVILSGLRIVVTQTIGLTVVAALIGAGGLGTFVFLGLGQNAVDLIMLGVIPTVAMALVAEAMMSIAVASMERTP